MTIKVHEMKRVSGCRTDYGGTCYYGGTYKNVTCVVWSNKWSDAPRANLGYQVIRGVMAIRAIIRVIGVIRVVRAIRVVKIIRVIRVSKVITGFWIVVGSGY